MRFPIVLEVNKCSGAEPITEDNTHGFVLTLQVGRLVLEHWFSLVDEEQPHRERGGFDSVAD